MNKIEKSKFLSLILRHKPEAGNIVLDKYGWAEVKQVLKALNISFNELDDIVQTDEKQRYSFNQEKSKIRANQGHSVPIDLDLPEQRPPKFLYHGTASRFLNSIYETGILSMKRNFIQLSADLKTAITVGKRHGQPVVLKVDSGKMAEDGYKFYISENGVWLTKEVKPQYIIGIERI